MFIRPRAQTRDLSGSAFGTITNYTSDQTIAVSQNFETFTNLGAVGQITLTLPTPAAGLQYTFIVATAQNIILDVGGSVVIAIGEGSPSSAGGSVACASPYSVLTLKAISATLWVGIYQLGGAWTPS